MTHDEAQALWLLANDGALDGERRRALNAHLAECDACRSEIDRLASADDALRAWGLAPVPTMDRAPKPLSPALSRGRWWPVTIAAALAGIAVGAASGFLAARRVAAPTQAAAPAPVDARPTFALLLEEPAASWPPVRQLMRPGYFEWRDTLVARRQYAGGERLSEDAGWYLAVGGRAIPAGSRSADANNYSGWFLVRARDYDEAIAIARGSPHLRYGGVLVRRAY